MTQSAQEMVDLYIEAEKDVLAGKSTTINGRVFTTEDLTEIRAGRKEWERRVLEQSAAAQGKPRKRHALANFCP